MKLFAFSDVHGNIKKINRILNLIKKEKPDVTICAGDISDFGKSLYNILKKFSNVKNFIIIPGNHEDENRLKRICKELKLMYLHKASFILDSFVFFGYGGGGFSKIEGEFESVSKRFMKTVGNRKIILVTHAPPYGTKIDNINGVYSGCISFNKFIEKTNPLLHICGHLHETGGYVDNIKSTPIINPGSSGKIIALSDNPKF
ncbi:MAG: metallophosphoesterase [Nanoarchaeota archaeon]